jgi:hypothetical protein
MLPALHFQGLRKVSVFTRGASPEIRTRARNNDPLLSAIPDKPIAPSCPIIAISIVLPSAVTERSEMIPPVRNQA